MEIINKRGGLGRTKAAIESGRLKIGFIGGSITTFGNYRSYNQPNIRNEYIDTCSVGARLKYEFNGTGTAILYMYGTKAAELYYSIDGGEFMLMPDARKTETWMGENNWYKYMTLAEGLPYGKHTCELEVRGTVLGSRCSIEMIGEIR